MTIRPYSPTDQPALQELLRFNTPQYFAESEKADLIDYLAHHIDHYYVVEVYGTIMGCGGFNRTPDGKHGVLSWDIIHPDAQGKGIGSTLAKFRIAEMQKLGMTEIGVRTSQHVYQFYEKMGFRLKEIVKDYWAEGFDLYEMEL
ncbi:GNAT family N-acetyltransferase [Flavobacterium sp. MFBS3-15]|uniref:GNAT family N-acetyltransferase n=1 Tax=Flavobacterium sp. MFBS3-15 TaxID=2989816 RepID=UPI0022368D72|nr:GNAT family N-acetyltransferase [Flavobacterium sp. MFBS3-15]MCW4468729.1 GNAT family N-acetyltransferase [Flavobacterium sp. MFBS3-15]